MHEKSNSGDRTDIIYTSVDINGHKLRGVIDCGATITMIRKDLVEQIGLRINKYTGNRISGITEDVLIPIGKTHLPLIITDYNGSKAWIHVDAVVCDILPLQLILGNNVSFKVKGVIDLVLKAYTFGRTQTPGTDIIVIPCKSCAKSKGNAIHVMKDIILPPRATKTIKVKASNSRGNNEIVCLVSSERSQYEKNRIWIPNTVIETKGRGEMTLAITNFNNETKSISSGTMLGTYEVIDEKYEVYPMQMTIKDDGMENCSDRRSANNKSQVGEKEVVLVTVEGISATKQKSSSDTECPCDLIEEIKDVSSDGTLLTEECKQVKINEGFVNVGITLTETQTERLVELIKRYIKRFAFRPDQIGRTTLLEHEINTGNAKPVRRGPYKCSIAEREIIQNQVKEYIEMGIMSPTRSPWGTGVVLVKKPDGTTRFCCDWRGLNEVTEFDTYPMVNIEQALTSLRGSKWFSLFDLNKGYHQVLIKESDRPKTAVITMDGVYQWNAMGMGLIGASATFQRLLDLVLSGLRFNTVICYVDDGIIYSSGSFEDHLNKIEEVLKRFEDANLTFKHEKCRFGMTRTRYLGHVIDAFGIAPDNEKIIQIKDRPTPRNVTEVRSFIGMAGYYRSFIKNFAIIAKPLTNLTKKNAKFIWNGEHEEAFKTLKNALCRKPVLSHFNPRLPTELRVDACDAGVGAILVQKHGNGWKVVSYAARCLSDVEKRYPIGEREMLAIVFGLTKFRCYLYGIEFVVVTDHANHKNIMKKLNPSDRVARWLLHCMDFKFTIEYRSGNRNKDADDLSRNPIGKAEHFDPTEILALFATAEPEVKDLEGNTRSLLESYPPLNLKIEQNADVLCGELINKLENIHVMSNKLIKKLSKFALIKGVLYRVVNSKVGLRYNIFVPKSLLRDVMYSLHEDPLSGHASFRKTLDRARMRFYWPKMAQYIRKYCKGCMDCQTKGVNNKLPAGLLQPIPVRGPFARVGIDAVGPFKLSNSGNKYILTATCYFTKYAEVRAVPDISAETTAKFIVEEIICRHGAVEELLSDLGRNFLADVVQQILVMVGTRHVRTTSYKPSTNGLDERFNGTLCRSISKYVDSTQKNWDEFIGMLRFAYNTTIQNSTKLSPFMILYGRDVRLPIDIITGEPVNRPEGPKSFAKDLMEVMPTIWKIVKENIRVDIEMSTMKKGHWFGFINQLEKEV